MPLLSPRHTGPNPIPTRRGEVGTISYSFREMPNGNDAGTILPHIVELGLSGIELMNGPAEAWAGAPTRLVAAAVVAGGRH